MRKTAAVKARLRDGWDNFPTKAYYESGGWYIRLSHLDDLLSLLPEGHYIRLERHHGDHFSIDLIKTRI